MKHRSIYRKYFLNRTGMETPLQIERHDGWALLRLARSAKRNALDRAMRSAMREALTALAGDGTRVIVVTGSGEGAQASFCAGLDLKEREADRVAGLADAAGEEWIALNMQLREHPAVLIAAVNGVAMGAGVTLLNSCDLALATDSASFSLPELNHGHYAGMAAPTMHLQQLARKRVAWLLFTAQRIDASTAERWGLVNEVVSSEALLPRASELAAQVARFDPAALAEVKRSLDDIPLEAGWREAMEFGQSVNARIREKRVSKS
jgi:enoyl-CoA hydratase/carnithine racemase